MAVNLGCMEEVATHAKSVGQVTQSWKCSFRRSMLVEKSSLSEVSAIIHFNTGRRADHLRPGQELEMSWRPINR